MLTQQVKKPLLLLIALFISSSRIYGTPGQENLTVSRPGQMLRFFFNPKHGWQATSYDQRYPGCTRQQVHRVYTADAVGLPNMLKNPNNLHWLKDHEEGREALYVGSLGLPGGMPPSKRVMGQAKKDLSAIALQATEQGKMDDLRRVLSQAQEGADFDGVYEQVFGLGTSETSDLAIFDLTVGEIQELSNYKEVVLRADSEDRIVDVGEEVLVDAQEVNPPVMSPAELVKALYSPVDSEQYQDACRLVGSRKYSMEYQHIIPQTARLLYQRYVDGGDDQAYGLHVFWRCVLSDPRDLVGIHQIVLNMCCMEACRGDIRGVVGKLHKPILDEITSWVLAAWDVKTEEDLTPALLPVLEHVWRRCPCVLSYRPLVEGVLSKLKKWGELPQLSEKAAQQTLSILKRLDGTAWPLAVQKALWHYVSSGCEHQHGQIHKAAVHVLAKALKRAYSKESWQIILETFAGLCKNSDCFVRHAAAENLAKALESEFSEGVKTTVLESLRSLCKDIDNDVRGAATEGLSKILESTCSDETWQSIIATLKNLCGDDSEWVCSIAVEGLSKGLKGACSQESWEARLEKLRSLCRDDSQDVRRAAAEGLSKGLGSTCSDQRWQAILKTLRDLCEDDAEGVRTAAAEGLSKGLGSACSEQRWQAILESLRHLCSDSDRDVRIAAAGGLSKVLESARSEEAWKASLESLRSLCQDRDGWVRSVAASGLSKGLNGCSEAKWQATLEAFSRLAQDQDWQVRHAGAEGLSKALEGEFAEEQWHAILEGFRSFLQDEYWYVRSAAAEGLSKTLEGTLSETRQEAILESLKTVSKDENYRVREAAAEGLSKGLEGVSEEGRQAVVETLRTLCKDDSERVRSTAAVGLSTILAGACSEEIWKAILETFRDLCEYKDSNIRRAAALGLSKALEGVYSENSWSAILELLRRLCKDQDDYVRRAALGGLSKALQGRCSKEGRESRVKSFMRLCKDESYRVREAAAEGLSKALQGKCSDQRRQAILESLRALCRDEDSGVRRAAAGGLSKALEGSCSEEGWKAILGALRGLFEDNNPEVRSAADQALVRAMDKKEILVHILMNSVAQNSPSCSWLPLPVLVELIATHSPCLVLPTTCDAQVSRHVKKLFAQERLARNWPLACKALTIIEQRLPSRPSVPICPKITQIRETRYHDAARKNAISALEKCQKNGLDINDHRNKAGKTPLMIALETGHQEATDWLLAHGAWVDVADNQDLAQSVLSLTSGPNKLGLRQALLRHRDAFPSHRITHVLAKLEHQLESVESNIPDEQYEALLDQAVGSLVGRSPSELRELVARNREWYKAALENRESSKFERRGRVYYTTGATVSSFLLMRIYIMIELLTELPSKKGLPYHKNAQVYTKEEMREELLSELCVALTTLWDNAAIEACRDDVSQLVGCFAEGVLKRLENANDQKMSLALGYASYATGVPQYHCIYTTLTKRGAYLVVRNDNRWLNSLPRSTKHRVASRTVETADGTIEMDHVKPYMVAHFPVSAYGKHKQWLRDYLEGAVRNYVDTACSVQKAMDHLYQAGQKAPYEGKQPEWTEDWPYRPIQTTACNAVMRNYNVGCRIRMGTGLYRWFRKQGSCSPLLAKRFADEGKQKDLVVKTGFGQQPIN